MSVFVKPSQLKIKGKNLNFSKYCKSHQNKQEVLVSGYFVNQGCQNRDSTGGFEIDLKEGLH